ncbi:MAG: hypothetical protein IJN32_06310 [Thermoguttaceae bacterium]|nr:hypothetical protein [Thermoguttaceae bacterium]
MTSVYWFCAILGSTLVLLQFFATLFGLGGGDLDADGVPDALDLDVETGTDGAEGGEAADGDASGVPFLKALSLRTATAGAAFFGLGGLAGEAVGLGKVATTGTAIVAGIAAIYGVYFLFRTLSRFSEDGSIRESTAVGATGTVYLRIPAKRSGRGKVVVSQQGRSMEYAAETDDESELATGTPIVVVKLIAPSTALVARR